MLELHVELQVVEPSAMSPDWSDVLSGEATSLHVVPSGSRPERLGVVRGVLESHRELPAV